MTKPSKRAKRKCKKAKSKRHGLHSCKSAEHYTPAEYIEGARYVLGSIDLDPASNPRANKTVNATHFYTKADDGLALPWSGNTFLNAPGDPRGYLVKAFWHRANRHVIFGPPDAAVLWTGYNIGALPRLHACEPFDDGTPCPGPLAWPFVLIGPQGPCTTTGGRICWISGETGEPGKQPGHGNYFCLLSHDRAQQERFREHFGVFGYYQAPRHLPRKRRDLAAEIRAVLENLDNGPMGKRELARALHARIQSVSQTVERLVAAGELVADGPRWRLATQLREEAAA